MASCHCGPRPLKEFGSEPRHALPGSMSVVPEAPHVLIVLCDRRLDGARSSGRCLAGLVPAQDAFGGKILDGLCDRRIAVRPDDGFWHGPDQLGNRHLVSDHFALISPDVPKQLVPELGQRVHRRADRASLQPHHPRRSGEDILVVRVSLPDGGSASEPDSFFLADVSSEPWSGPGWGPAVHERSVGLALRGSTCFFRPK